MSRRAESIDVNSPALQCRAVFPSQLGWMAACWQGSRLQQLLFGYTSQRKAQDAMGGQAADRRSLEPPRQELIYRLQAVAQGEADDFLDVELDLHDRTAFQRAVICQCRQIPWGEVRTYGQLGALAGYPRAARAVGSVMAANRVPLIVPCHRVVGAAGNLGGFSAPQGLSMKRRLLQLEGFHEPFVGAHELVG
ncbi:MAG: methylated-DNA--[protein]-cysteine S-methyltransferase [Pirellulaceae bacterium]